MSDCSDADGQIELDSMLDDEGPDDEKEGIGFSTLQLVALVIVAGALLLGAFALLRYFMVVSYGP